MEAIKETVKAGVALAETKQIRLAKLAEKLQNASIEAAARIADRTRKVTTEFSRFCELKFTNPPLFKEGAIDKLLAASLAFGTIGLDDMKLAVNRILSAEVDKEVVAKEQRLSAYAETTEQREALAVALVRYRQHLTNIVRTSQELQEVFGLKAA